MRVINRVLLPLLGGIMLSSCSSVDKVRDGKELLAPEQFIEEKKSTVERMVSLGPKIDSSKENEINKHIGKRINTEERQNSIEVNENNSSVFSVSLNFENIQIRDAMTMLSEITGNNILVSDEVDGKVSARLISVPWDKALDSILKTKGLAKHVDSESNIIRIHKQDVLVEQEEFDRKRIEDMQKTLAAQRAIEPLHTEIFRLYYTDTKVVKGEIEGVLGVSSSDDGGADSSSSGGGGSVEIIVDERINSLIVKATEEDLKLISRLIDEIDVRTKQVLIEAFIVEATDDFAKELGARLGYNNTTLFDNYPQVNDFTTEISGVTSGTAGTNVLGTSTGTVSNLAVTAPYGGIGFLFSTSAATLKAELTAMEKDNLTKIISNPRVFTLDNQEAVINQGEEVPYPVDGEDGITWEFKDAGTKLTVTPSIVGDGNVILDVVVEKKTPNWAQSATEPPIDTNEIITKLLVQDHSIVVIGGVFTTTTTDIEEKVPFFGDLPVVGSLFKRNTDTNVHKELLIFLAPRVI